LKFGKILEDFKKKQKIVAAYWHRDGLEIYNFAEEQPIRHASGAPAELQPVRNILATKVLIVGREQTMHLRKRYPPAAEDKLKKAVAMEIEEIFPIVRPTFYCRVFKAISSYVEMDIWAWESEPYEKIREVFPFTHAVPEDLLFLSEQPEVRVFPQRGLVHMVAHARGVFLDGVSLPPAKFDEGQIRRFLFGLSQIGAEMEKITIYGLPGFQMKAPTGVNVVRLEERIYPLCLEGVPRLELKEFRIKGAYQFVPFLQPALVARIFIYLTSGYALFLFLTMMNYDQAAKDIRQRIAAMDRKALALAASSSEPDYSDVLRELNGKLEKSLSPIGVFDMLAQKLPEGSFITRIAAAENHLDIFVSSRAPLTVIKELGNEQRIKKVIVKGSPVKDRATGFYNVSLTLELAK